MQREKIQLELTQQEYDILSFYRTLKGERKELFLVFLTSLAQLMQESKEE